MGSAFAAASVCASAQTGSLQVVAKDAEGQIVAEAPVSLESRLQFSEEGVEVMTDESLSAVFHYADMHSIGFKYGSTTRLQALDKSESLLLRQNPVPELLEFKQHPAEAANLTITDLKGEVRYSANGWKGEAVNVASLTPGLYFVTVNGTTLKFIKK